MASINKSCVQVSDEMFAEAVCTHESTLHYDIELNDRNVSTPASDVARRGCLKCIQREIHHIDSLTDKPRLGMALSAKKSAQRFVLEGISLGKFEGRDIPIASKFRAIRWCLERGFKPCQQIFSYTFPYSPQQLEIFASHGACPMGFNLDDYVRAKKLNELKAIYDNFADEDHEHGNYKECIHAILTYFRSQRVARKFFIDRMGKDVSGVIMSFARERCFEF